MLSSTCVFSPCLLPCSLVLIGCLVSLTNTPVQSFAHFWLAYWSFFIVKANSSMLSFSDWRFLCDVFLFYELPFYFLDSVLWYRRVGCLVCVILCSLGCLKLLILLSPLPRCTEYRCVPPCSEKLRWHDIWILSCLRLLVLWYHREL